MSKEKTYTVFYINYAAESHDGEVAHVQRSEKVTEAELVVHIAAAKKGHHEILFFARLNQTIIDVTPKSKSTSKKPR